MINVYDVGTLQLVHQLTGHKASEGRVSSLAYSGRQLWSSSTDGSIRCDILDKILYKFIKMILLENATALGERRQFYIGGFVLLKFIEQVHSMNFSNTKPPM